MWLDGDMNTICAETSCLLSILKKRGDEFLPVVIAAVYAERSRDDNKKAAEEMKKDVLLAVKMLTSTEGKLNYD